MAEVVRIEAIMADEEGIGEGEAEGGGEAEEGVVEEEGGAENTFRSRECSGK